MTKKIFYLVLLLMPFVMGSCSKDEPEGGDNGIIGKWTGKVIDGDDEGEWTITFKKDGTFVWKDSWKDEDGEETDFWFGTYTYDSEGEILKLTTQGDDYNGDWDKEDYETEYYECSIKGNKMTLKVDYDEIVIFTRN